MRHSKRHDDPQPGGRSTRRYLPAALALVAGLLATAALFTTVRGWERERLEGEFHKQASAIATSLQKGLDHCLDALEFIGGLFDASGEVTRQEFATFVSGPLSHHPMIQAMEWVPRIEDSRRASFEEVARREGFAGFHVTERRAQGEMVRAQRRPEYYPVSYVEPLRGNELAVGYDLASDATRRAALEEARDTGRMVATGRTTLVQETGGQFGFVAFRPVYQKGATHRTVEERRANLAGFGLAVIRIGDLVEGWLKGVASGGVGFRLEDASGRPSEGFLYRYDGSPASSRGAFGPTEALGGLTTRATITLPGRQWSIHLYPTPAFFASHGTSQAWIILVGGLLFTALLCAYLLHASRHAAALEEEVAERRRAEEQLRKFSDVVQQSPCTVVITDLDGAIEYVNPKFTEATGYTLDEVRGKNPRILKSGEQPRAFYRELWETITGGRKWLGEFHNKKKSGELYWELASISPIKNGKGAATHYVKVAEVITERKEAEERLREAHERLRETCYTLEKAQGSAVASAKMAALGRLTAGASHEILNPLNGINLTLHLLVTDPATPPETVEDLRGAMEMVERIATIVDNLLYFSKQRQPKRGSVDLNETVLRGLRLEEPQIKFQQVEVELALDEELPCIQADRGQLQQVILNLLSNALDAMPQGGRLTLKTGSALTNGWPHVELRVEDTGPGIAPEHMDKLFEPFFTTKPEGEGTGLGLSICQGIVESHGGTLAAENLPGGGAAFVVRLPEEG